MMVDTKPSFKECNVDKVIYNYYFHEFSLKINQLLLNVRTQLIFFFLHVRIVADLRLGVYYQKCHDPDCRRIDYRSPGM